MAVPDEPGETGKTGARNEHGPDVRDEDLERRRRSLEATLAARRPQGGAGAKDANTGGATGYGQALKLSSEFIAGIAVGAGLGWMIDRVAGTSPWGLIILLLLGFCAGVLNVLRSAGLVAQSGPQAPKKGDGTPEN